MAGNMEDGKAQDEGMPEVEEREKREHEREGR